MITGIDETDCIFKKLIERDWVVMKVKNTF
jgi:hypothetical protein